MPNRSCSITIGASGSGGGIWIRRRDERAQPSGPAARTYQPTEPPSPALPGRPRRRSEVEHQECARRRGDHCTRSVGDQPVGESDPSPVHGVGKCTQQATVYGAYRVIRKFIGAASEYDATRVGRGELELRQAGNRRRRQRAIDHRVEVVDARHRQSDRGGGTRVVPPHGSLTCGPQPSGVSGLGQLGRHVALLI